jgi:hypothetical protein
MMIDGRKELENGKDLILRNNESDYMKTDERELQPLKQPEPIISTFHGKQCDFCTKNIELESSDQNSARSNHEQPNIRFLPQSK